MTAVWVPVLLLGSLSAQTPQPVSFLFEPAACLDGIPRGAPRPYAPQPGDIILSTDHSAIVRAGHFLAGSGGVQHSGIVFACPGGTLAVLEAGPFNSLSVKALDSMEVLTGHERRGEKVWLRQRVTPLTPEESERLSAYALAQVGRRFAWPRTLAQLTPFRMRGPLRTYCVGKPHGERRAYFCSELVTEACIAAGLIDAEQARPAATFPRDLFLDRSANHFLDEHRIYARCWLPPARWVSCP